MPERWQVIDQELSGGQPASERRRRLVITSIVGVPIAIGALVSIVLYSTRVLPPTPPALPSLPSPSATDTFVRDGQVLLLEPATSAPVSMLPGEEIEIVLNTGVGQTVSTLEPFVLAMVPNPPCHVTAICGVKGAVSWTFVGRHPGETDLHVIFGTGDCPQRASCPRLLQLVIPVTVQSAPS